MTDIEVFKSNESGIICFESVLGTNWKFMAIASTDYYQNDIEVSIFGYGNTEEEARNDLEKKLFIYKPLWDEFEE